jgi:hypothetical protein
VRFRSRVNLSLPRTSALVNATAWLEAETDGRTCKNAGKAVIGKKVPLRRNIGVMKRKLGS